MQVIVVMEGHTDAIVELDDWLEGVRDGWDDDCRKYSGFNVFEDFAFDVHGAIDAQGFFTGTLPDLAVCRYAIIRADKVRRLIGFGNDHD